MSLITDMVLTTWHDDEAVARLNAWCAEHDTQRQQQFAKLNTDAAGGLKVFTGDIWAMAGNYFPWWELTQVFGSFGWYNPEKAVLIVEPEGEDGVLIFRGTDPAARSGDVIDGEARESPREIEVP